MAEPGGRTRNLLRAPRVEFDLSALGLGVAGYFAYLASWPVLAWVLGVEGTAAVPPWKALQAEFFGRILAWVGIPYGPFVAAQAGWPGAGEVNVRTGEGMSFMLGIDWWKLVIVGAWLLILWSLVSGAISRVYAVRIARDETVPAGDAAGFATSNLRTFLLAPLFVAAAALLFLGGIALIGALSAIPWAGPLVQLVLHPFALVASLLVMALAIGGIFGFPILHAAIATERNGALDAVSRTFSYVFTRPVVFIVAAGSTLVIAGILLAFGYWFVAVSGRALHFGAQWNDNAAGAMASVWPPSMLAMPNVDGVGVDVAAWRLVTWFWTIVALYLVHGFVLSYVVGGLTDTYFLLRREVDGIEDSEVWVEGEGEPPTFGAPVPGEPTPPPPPPAAPPPDNPPPTPPIGEGTMI